MLNRERILKVAKEKDQLKYEDRPTRITLDFSMKTLKARRTCTDVVQTLQIPARLLYPARLSITVDEETTTVHDKAKFI